MTIVQFALGHGIDRNLIYEAFRMAEKPVKNRQYTEDEIRDVVKAELTRRMDYCRQKMGMYETVMGRLGTAEEDGQ